VKPIYKKSTEQKEITGLSKRGEDIFHKHAVASCIRCHKVENEGGIIGPALDGIASRKDRDYLHRALINPTAELAEGFDKLGASPMPPMNILLNEQQMADVMAYLMTLK
jgi:mono/diheme cytochrome c family protein